MSDEDENKSWLEKLGLLMGILIILLILASICMRTAPNPCAGIPGARECNSSPCGCCDVDGNSRCACCDPVFSVWNYTVNKCCKADEPTACSALNCSAPQGNGCPPGQTECNMSNINCSSLYGGCCLSGYTWNEGYGCCWNGQFCQCPNGRECPPDNELCPFNETLGRCCPPGYSWSIERGCCLNSQGRCSNCNPVTGCCPCVVPCPSGCCDASGRCVMNCSDVYGPGWVTCPPEINCESGCCKYNATSGEWICAGGDGGRPPPGGGGCSGGMVECSTIGVNCSNGAKCCTPDGECMGVCKRDGGLYDLNGDCILNGSDAQVWDDWYKGYTMEVACPPEVTCQQGELDCCKTYEFNNDFIVNDEDRGCICQQCSCTNPDWICLVPGCVPAGGGEQPPPPPPQPGETQAAKIYFVGTYCGTEAEARSGEYSTPISSPEECCAVKNEFVPGTAKATLIAGDTLLVAFTWQGYDCSGVFQPKCDSFTVDGASELWTASASFSRLMAGTQYSIDCGNGDVKTETATGSTASASKECTYPDGGDWTVRAYTQNPPVECTPHAITATLTPSCSIETTPDSPTTEDTVTAKATFAHMGSVATTAYIDCENDGTPETSFLVQGIQSQGSASCKYSAAGDYTIAATGAVSCMKAITVTAPSSCSLSASQQTVQTGEATTLTAVFDQMNGKTALISCGNGGAPESVSITENHVEKTVSCTYDSEGEKTATATAGGTDCGSATITVEAPPSCSIETAPDSPTTEDTVTATATFEHMGPTSKTATIDCGAGTGPEATFSVMGTTSTGSASCTYSTAGDYTITAAAEGGVSCASAVAVAAPPTP